MESWSRSLDIAAWEAAVGHARAIARRFASDVRGHFGSRVREIRLYGSAARGDWMPDSDIDVLVLLDRVSTEDVEWLSRHALVVGVMESGIVLQPLPMSEEDFSRLKACERRFALDVEAEGISL